MNTIYISYIYVCACVCVCIVARGRMFLWMTVSKKTLYMSKTGNTSCFYYRAILEKGLGEGGAIELVCCNFRLDASVCKFVQDAQEVCHGYTCILYNSLGASAYPISVCPVGDTNAIPHGLSSHCMYWQAAWEPASFGKERPGSPCPIGQPGSSCPLGAGRFVDRFVLRILRSRSSSTHAGFRWSILYDRLGV